MPQPIVCAVTGANGYVGSAIVRAIDKAGMRTVPLCRGGKGGPESRAFQLDGAVAPRLLEGIHALVHCAWDFQASSVKQYQAINVDGSLRLFRAAEKAGVPSIVFISTMSAFPGCRSNYGRAKLAVQTAAASWRIHIVRPGLVYGPASRGMIGSLAKLTSLPVLPLVGAGGQMLYLTHEDDLGELARGMCDGTISRQDNAVVAANPRPYRLREILRLLAASRGKKPLLMPVPWRLEWLALKLTEIIGVKSRLRSDSLISLINQELSPDFGPTENTRLTFRDFADEIQRGLQVV
jgi:nucleoside-diphosphate-sugar epimerase